MSVIPKAVSEKKVFRSTFTTAGRVVVELPFGVVNGVAVTDTLLKTLNLVFAAAII